MNAKRHITAFLLLPLFVLYVVKLPPSYFTALVAVVSAAGIWEFYTMYKVNAPLKYAGAALGLLIPLAVHAGGTVDAVFASLIVIAAMRLFIKADPSSSLAETAPAVFGLLYIPGLLSYQVLIRKDGPELILFLYAAVWGADSMAYYMGKSLGKRKLYESVSPNKTLAGAVGSLIGSVGAALIIKALLVPQMPPGVAALTGAAIGAVSVVGDLVESMFKRDAGVKDSSSLIPGHGGVLDKVDGPIFAGPVLWWMLRGLEVVR